MHTDPLETAAVRSRLLIARADLSDARESTAESRAPVELDQTAVGRLSRMDAMQAQAMALATERRRTNAIQRIEQALARLDAGTYAECVMCGETIGPKRLALDPAVATCLACTSGERE